MAISSEARITCTRCKETLPLDRFYFRKSKNRLETRCKACIKIFNREYYEKNTEQIKRINTIYRQQHWEERAEKRKSYHKSRHLRLKMEALKRIGLECVCCGEKMFEFLSIDHVNEDGDRHRREINNRNIYEWLSNNNYECSYELQTLCFNCNFGKQYNNGVCPHRERSETIRKEYTSSEVEAPSPWGEIVGIDSTAGGSVIISR